MLDDYINEIIHSNTGISSSAMKLAWLLFRDISGKTSLQVEIVSDHVTTDMYFKLNELQFLVAGNNIVFTDNSDNLVEIDRSFIDNGITTKYTPNSRSVTITKSNVSITFTLI